MQQMAAATAGADMGSDFVPQIIFTMSCECRLGR